MGKQIGRADNIIKRLNQFAHCIDRPVLQGQHQGQEDGYEGLGIKIATVQIREALVSSQSLWTDLQSPFRHEISPLLPAALATTQILFWGKL